MSPNEVGTMNRDESIALVNELCSEYRAVKELQKKIDENGTMLRELNDTKSFPKGLFAFFRRYLVMGLITFAVMLFPTIMLSAVIFFISFESNLKPVYPKIAIAFVISVNIAVPAIIIACGYRKAKRKKSELDRQAVEKAEYNQKRVDELMRQTDDLLKQKEAKLESLQKYNDLIPEALREGEKMEKLKRLLVTGKAETIADATEMLSTDQIR